MLTIVDSLSTYMSSSLVWKKFVNDYLRGGSTSILGSILKKTNFVRMDESRVFVNCLNLGAKMILESKKNTLEELFSKRIGKQIGLFFFIDEAVKTKKIPPESPLLNYADNKTSAVEKAGLQASLSFDDFAVSSSNQIAYTAATAVAENPGHTYNPLFLYGGVGVGKTHLAQSIGHKIIDQNVESRVYYCSSEDFTNDLIELIRVKNTANFRKKYRFLNVLIIDDVQFIAGKSYVQEELYHTFNTIIKRGGQIVLTSDRHPREISKLEDRLRSRFSGGLTIDIQNPDFELRTAILLIKARARNIDIDLDVAKAIAEKVVDSRELEGRLLGFYSEALRNNSKILLNSVRDDFEKQKKEQNKRIAPGDILKSVCSFYNISLSQIKSRTRKESVVVPRQIIMYLLRRVLSLKYEEIAFILKRADHTTIMHGEGRVVSLISKNASLKEEVDRIISLLKI